MLARPACAGLGHAALASRLRNRLERLVRVEREHLREHHHVEAPFLRVSLAQRLGCAPDLVAYGEQRLRGVGAVSLARDRQHARAPTHIRHPPPSTLSPPRLHPAPPPASSSDLSLPLLTSLFCTGCLLCPTLALPRPAWPASSLDSFYSGRAVPAVELKPLHSDVLGPAVASEAAVLSLAGHAERVQRDLDRVLGGCAERTRGHDRRELAHSDFSARLEAVRGQQLLVQHHLHQRVSIRVCLCGTRSWGRHRHPSSGMCDATDRDASSMPVRHGNDLCGHQHVEARLSGPRVEDHDLVPLDEVEVDKDVGVRAVGIAGDGHRGREAERRGLGAEPAPARDLQLGNHASELDGDEFGGEERVDVDGACEVEEPRSEPERAARIGEAERKGGEGAADREEGGGRGEKGSHDKKREGMQATMW